MNRLSRLVTAVSIAVTLIGATATAAADTRSIPALGNYQLGSEILGFTNTPVIPLVQVTSPGEDPFYTPPSPLPAGAPGTLLGSRKVNVQFDALIAPLPLIVNAWQIQYLSTDTLGHPVMDIATVIVPFGASKNAPLLSYQTATDSDSLNFSTSYLLRTGGELETALFGLGLMKGWKVVVPDFEGLDAQYTAGRQAGHATLDAIRAAEQLSQANFKDGTATPVVMWGYSGGAQATAWATELQPTYAPELNILGAAEGGIPVNVAHVANLIDGSPFSGIYFAAAIGLSRAYNLPIQSMLNSQGQTMYNHVSNYSISEALSGYALQHINDYLLPAYQNPLQLPQFQGIVTDDTLGQATPTVPLYIYGGTISDILPEADAHALGEQYCAAGVLVQAQFFPGEHLTSVVTGALPALAWLSDRVAGKMAPNNCGSF